MTRFPTRDVVLAGSHCFCIRRGSLDLSIVGEMGAGQYETRCVFSPDDVWLDAGAHIGTFCVPAAGRVARVVAYEPEPDNYGLLCRNLALNGVGNVDARRAALVGDGDPERALHLHPRRNTAAHSLLALDGYEPIAVPCENVNNALAGVDCVKMDVEGAEAELLIAVEDWSPVRQLVVEWHYQQLGWGPGKMLDLLRAHFDRVECEPQGRNGAGFIVCRRKS